MCMLTGGRFGCREVRRRGPGQRGEGSAIDHGRWG